MIKDLQAGKQRVEQSIGSAMVEMRKTIIVEVLTLETTMWKHYDGFVTVHNIVFHLYGFKQ